MCNTLEKDKRRIRGEIRAAIAAMTPQLRTAEDEFLRGRVGEVLRRWLAENTGGHILAYLPLPDEPNLYPLLPEIALAGRLCLPRVNSDGTMRALMVHDLAGEVVPGTLGVREPEASCAAVAAEEIGLIIVPGRAFTRTGLRRGRGMGCYDRFLALCNRAQTIAAAYSAQMLPALPTTTHDRPVGQVFCAEKY